jgi:hypothetical protein
MGYFAVIQKDGDAPKVERCHINIWRYDGFFTPLVCLFDVGLALSAPEPPAVGKKFRIALPFSTDDPKPVDLAKTMKLANVATLIFGRVVTLQGDHISYEDRDGPVRLRLVTPDKISRDEEKSGPGYSVWNVELDRAPQANETLYVRMRFYVAGFPRGWVRHGDAEILDFRVADTRESVSISAWSFDEAALVPIPNVRVFIVAPASRRPLVSSPGFDARALEGTIWKAYTRCRSAWWSRAASRFTVIYGFKPPAAESGPIKPSNPFRLYFTLGRRRWPRSLWFVGGGIALLIAVAAGLSGYDWSSIVDRAWNALRAYIIGLVSLGGLVTVISKGRWLLQRWNWMGEQTRRWDRARLFEKD